MKPCRNCGVVRPLDRFQAGRATCKDCRNAYQQMRKASNPERAAELVQKQRERRADPEYRERQNALARARRAADPELRARQSRATMDWEKRRMESDPEYRAQRRAYHQERKRRYREDPKYLERQRKNAQDRALRDYVPPKPGKYSGRFGYVYRLYGKGGALLYVGKTWNVRDRFYLHKSAHARTKPWWDEVHLVRVDCFDTERDALAAEAWAIAVESPAFNQVKPTSDVGIPPMPLSSVSGRL